MTRPTDTAETAIERGPRLALAWASAVYAVATLLLGFPALVGRFLVTNHSDQYIAGYAFREFAAATLRAAGHFPLWNPYLLGGMPYVAAMHGDIFYPTFLLRMVLPTDVAMTWGFMIHVFLAGLFTYAFLRSLGLGFWAALVGGLAYMMGGNVAGQVSPGHDGKLFVSSLLPLMLLLVVRGVRDGKAWTWGAMALVMGLAVLSPHPQLLQYMLLTAGALGLFLAFSDSGAGRLPRMTALRRLAMSAVSLVVGGAMGAIQYLPVREYVPWSPRAGGRPWDIATSFSLPPEETINFYLPQFSGILERYWGRNGIHLHSEYIGVAVLILAGLAFSRAWPSVQRRLVWFWTGALTISLLWAMGGFTPFYRIVYAIVPGTPYFRAPSTMLYVVSFCVAVLAAFGAERVLRREVTRRYLIGWVIAAAAIGVAGAAGGLTNLGTVLARPGAEDYVLANDGAVRLGALRATLFAVLTLTCLFLMGSRRLSRQMSGALLAAIVAVDLWSVERLYWSFSAPASQLFAPDAITEYINKQPEPGRVLPLQFKAAAVSHEPYLFADGFMVQRIRSVSGYHGNELGRYQRIGGKDEQWQQRTINPNFWRLYNVRYVVTDADSLPVPSLKRVLGPVTNAAGTTEYLYAVTDDNPAAWVAPVIVKAPDESTLATVLDPRFDVRRAAIFDTGATVGAQAVDTLPPPLALKARTTRFEPGAIDVELEQPAPAGSALLVSENYYPGWSAEVDGKPGTVGRADLTLIGVELPAGARKVTLRFSSAPFETGKSITLIALALALLAWGGGALIDRRPRA